jgi:hypothetical protein
VNDFDRGARHAVKLEPEGTKRLLFPRLKASLRFERWLDAQSAPRPGEPDRRCDTIAQLIDDEGLIPPWVMIVELFTEADGGAVDRAMEYVARYRGEMRHGPGKRDKYLFMVALVFLTGAPEETKVDMEAPGMPEVGHWFHPLVFDFAAQDAVARLDAIEHNRVPRGLLVWVPLMKGGQTEEIVRRWRTLAEPDERVKTLVDLALVFSRLTKSEDTWKTGLEGIMVKTSPLMDEVRAETRQKDTLEILKHRFPGAVSPKLEDQIKSQMNLDKLGEWVVLAATSDSVESFQAGLN